MPKQVVEEKKQEEYEKGLPTEAKKGTSNSDKKTVINEEIQLDESIQKELNETIDVNVAPLSSMTEFNLLKKSDVEKCLYKLIQENNLECHKAQFILDKIILEI